MTLYGYWTIDSDRNLVVMFPGNLPSSPARDMRIKFTIIEATDHFDNNCLQVQITSGRSMMPDRGFAFINDSVL